MNLLDGKSNKYFYYIRFYTIETFLRDRHRVDFSLNNCVAVYYLKQRLQAKIDGYKINKGLDMINNLGFENRDNMMGSDILQ